MAKDNLVEEEGELEPEVPAGLITDQTSFDEFIQRGLDLREKADNLQWEFGDLALEFTRLMGKKFLPDLARGIGIKISTLRRYRDVSAIFPLKVRQAFPMLSWSHFREVAASEDRHVLLTKAENENWSVDQLSREAKPKQEENLLDQDKQVPPKPEFAFDREVKLWYIANESQDARYVKAHIVKD